MTDTGPHSLEEFIDRAPASEKSLLLFNRTRADPVVNLLERGLTDQPIPVAERQLPEGEDDLVCLVDDGEVVATSPLSQLEEAYLLVNADRYRTGTRQSDAGSFPDVLTGLTDIEFTVRGYPDSAKEKLLLILLSRFIERRALKAGAGTLRATFQRLSRLDDEYGTRTIYQWLADSDVATHVYGVRDDPEVIGDMDVTVHAGRDDHYRRAWVVVFSPPADDPDADGHAALVAVQTDSNLWRGTWTFDPARVTRIEDYVSRRF